MTVNKESLQIGILIPSDMEKRITKISPENGEEFSLEELQKYVEGHIEGLQLDRNIKMWVNEDGSMLKLPLNTRATLTASNLVVGEAIIIRTRRVN
jgi:hypothetical protein